RAGAAVPAARRPRRPRAGAVGAPAVGGVGPPGGGRRGGGAGGGVGTGGDPTGGRGDRRRGAGRRAAGGGAGRGVHGDAGHGGGAGRSGGGGSQPHGRRGVRRRRRRLGRPRGESIVPAFRPRPRSAPGRAGAHRARCVRVAVRDGAGQWRLAVERLGADHRDRHHHRAVRRARDLTVVVTVPTCEGG